MAGQVCVTHTYESDLGIFSPNTGSLLSLSLSVSVWTQQLRELIQLNQLTTYKSLPPHPTHWKSRSVIPKKKTQSPLASSWSVNQPELCSELCSEDCLTAACLALHLLRAVLRGLPDGSLLGTTFAQSFAQRSA